jgi:dethiobiotin synthetase
MSEGVIILGSDTGVGKTLVAAALLLGLRERGATVSAIKPVETGWDDEYPRSDGRLLALAAAEEFAAERHVPNRYARPLAPLAAARDEDRPFPYAEAVACIAARRKSVEFLLVETAGGILVPLDEHHNNAHLARECGLPAIVVGRAGLGTINHTSLTCDRAEHEGIEVLGFVLNGREDGSASAGGGNAAMISQLTGRPCLGRIPHLSAASTPTGQADATGWMEAANEAAQHLAWRTLRERWRCATIGSD